MSTQNFAVIFSVQRRSIEVGVTAVLKTHYSSLEVLLYLFLFSTRFLCTAGVRNISYVISVLVNIYRWDQVSKLLIKSEKNTFRWISEAHTWIILFRGCLLYLFGGIYPGTQPVMSTYVCVLFPNGIYCTFESWHTHTHTL